MCSFNPPFQYSMEAPSSKLCLGLSSNMQTFKDKKKAMISPGLGHAPTMMLDLTAHNMERQLQKKNSSLVCFRCA